MVYMLYSMYLFITNYYYVVVKLKNCIQSHRTFLQAKTLVKLIYKQQCEYRAKIIDKGKYNYNEYIIILITIFLQSLN